MLSHLLGVKQKNKVKKNDSIFKKSQSKSKFESKQTASDCQESKQSISDQDQKIKDHTNDQQNIHRKHKIPQDRKQWFIPVIQGYYGTFQYFFQQSQKLTTKVQFYLIARRSKHRSGTRFYNRGIDQSGKVSNFIQTQIALKINGNLVSIKYYTGSIPIFWQQKSQLSKIKLTRQRQLQIIPFENHINSLLKQSKHLMLINLLQKKKQNQYLLTKQYQFLVQHFNSHSKQFNSKVRYAFFDINFYDKNGQQQKIWQFVNQMYEMVSGFRWFHINIQSNIIYSRQKGVFRVSCLDCLARTNRFMQILSFQGVYLILEKFNLFQFQEKFKNFKKISLQLLVKSDEKLDPFLRYYRLLWQQKSEYESIIYSGTGSTLNAKTKFMNYLQSTIISLQRYYTQKFIDQLKQRSLDIILYHKNYQPIYRSKHKLPFNVSLFTWNVNAMNPQSTQNIYKIVDLLKSQKSDLIIFGIQEMIELNTNNVMNDNTEESKQSKKWHKVIQNCLNKNSKFNSNSNSPRNNLSPNKQIQKKQHKKYTQNIKIQKNILIQQSVNNVDQQQFLNINYKRNTDNNNEYQKQIEYVFLQKIQMIGLFMIIFINKKWIHSIKSIQKDTVKTGIKIGVSQKYGNKGGIIIRIKIFQTTLSFICAHLSAHQSKIKQRLNDFYQIHKKAFQQDKQSIQNQLELQYSDYRFFFGDLNFRIDGQFKQIKQIIQNEIQSNVNKQQLLEKLIQRDQLFKLMKPLKQGQQIDIQYLKSYQQSKINFLPTYKLQKSTGKYSLQKSRIPSYCDRILFAQNQEEQNLNIDQIQYTDLQVIGSDHRPVIGQFKLNILKQTRKNNESVILEQSYIQQSQYITNNNNKK